jgi:acetolactate synthase-1/3 small subunit
MNTQDKKLFTIIIFSENTVGLLNQITIVFTRRQLNIETLSVAPSAIAGVHKFTITTFADELTIEKIVKQIDKRVGILKSYYHTDEDLIRLALTQCQDERLKRSDKLFTNYKI